MHIARAVNAKLFIEVGEWTYLFVSRLVGIRMEISDCRLSSRCYGWVASSRWLLSVWWLHRECWRLVREWIYCCCDCTTVQFLVWASYNYYRVNKDSFSINKKHHISTAITENFVEYNQFEILCTVCISVDKFIVLRIMVAVIWVNPTSNRTFLSF